MQISAGDLGYLSIGIVFLAMGLITLLLTILRSASRDASIFLFGAMSMIWGARFLLYTGIAPQLLPVDPGTLARVARGFTYFSGAAAFGFTLMYLGPGWRKSLRILAAVSLTFACLASALLVALPDPDLLISYFNLLVLAGLATVLGNTLHPEHRRDQGRKGLMAGFCFAMLFFILENLRALSLVHLPWDVEWIGVLVLYLTLGRLIAVRMFTNERHLAEINHELAMACRIQVSLLPPSMPRMPGLDIAARYVPMNHVAGDLYDFVKIDEQHLCILIADVSGHGIPAALIASMVKGAFRAQHGQLQHPHRVLAGMNRILASQFEAQFVTASCALIDLEASKLLYAAAGHPPMLVQGPGADPIRLLQENGLMLGPFPEAVYRCVEHSLIGGERLLLCTDGILEASSADGSCFGDRALGQTLQGQRGLPVEHCADQLMEAIDQWANVGPGGSHEDDLTFIIVDVHSG